MKRIPRIKRCPFCGAVPVVQPWHGGLGRETLIECVECDCYVKPWTVGNTPEGALWRWNQRACGGGKADRYADVVEESRKRVDLTDDQVERLKVDVDAL